MYSFPFILCHWQITLENNVTGQLQLYQILFSVSVPLKNRFKKKCLCLQDDHKLTLEDLGKRYGVDLTRVTTHKHKQSHLHMHRNTHTHTHTRQYRSQRCNLCVSVCVSNIQTETKHFFGQVWSTAASSAHLEPHSSLIPQSHRCTHRHTHFDATTDRIEHHFFMP